MFLSVLLDRILVATLLLWTASAKSILFERGTVISFDETGQIPLVLRNTSILITDDTIAAIFDSNGNTTIPPSTERIPADNDIISPGFIDTHRHIWQTVHRTLGSNSTVTEYLSRWANSALASRIFDPEVMYYSQLTGLCEALNAGITSIVDNASGAFTEEIARAEVNASMDSGIRVFFAYLISENLSDFPIEEQIRVFHELIDDETVSQSLVRMGLAYEAFEMGSPNLTQTVMDLARSTNISVFETHFVGGSLGLANSPTLFSQLDFLNVSFPIIFAHADHMTPVDAALLRSHNQYIALVPEFEMHHGQDNYIPSLVQDQASLSVGTHYAMSGDIVSQARIWLQSVRSFLAATKLREFKIPINNPMSVNQAFLLATRSGGLALRRPDLGVLRVGAKADIAVFDGTAPGMLGWQDPVAAVILHSNVGNVKHVVVDGQWRKRDGELLCALNQTQVQTKFLESARKVQQFWAEMPPTVIEGVSPFTGSPYERVTEIDVVRGPLIGY